MENKKKIKCKRTTDLNSQSLNSFKGTLNELDIVEVRIQLLMIKT